MRSSRAARDLSARCCATPTSFARETISRRHSDEKTEGHAGAGDHIVKSRRATFSRRISRIIRSGTEDLLKKSTRPADRGPAERAGASHQSDGCPAPQVEGDQPSAGGSAARRKPAIASVSVESGSRRARGARRILGARVPDDGKILSANDRERNLHELANRMFSTFASRARGSR